MALQIQQTNKQTNKHVSFSFLAACTVRQTDTHHTCTVIEEIHVNFDFIPHNVLDLRSRGKKTKVNL